MKDRTQKFRFTAHIKAILVIVLLLLTTTSCIDVKSLVASETGNAVIKVLNYTDDRYELHVRAGLEPMKKIQYQEGKTFWISMEENSYYAYTDLSVNVVEKRTNRTVNSHKGSISFQPRKIGPAIIQISNPDEIRFDIE